MNTLCTRGKKRKQVQSTIYVQCSLFFYRDRIQRTQKNNKVRSLALEWNYPKGTRYRKDIYIKCNNARFECM